MPSSGGDDDGSGETLAAPSGEGLGSQPTVASKGGRTSSGPSDELPEISRLTYAVRRELARGGMGRILLAEDRRLGRQVALKELITPDAGLARRFAREVRVTARLAHPSIVTVYEAGHWPDGAPFYAMKMVAGKSLEKVVEERPALADRLRLLPSFLQLAEAMAYAHGQGVIHRDLKPANVLLGDFGETVVIDWGLAKDTREADAAEPLPAPAASDAALTLHGSVMGTPGYMPPEQARGEPVDARADVYALGALMWHVLAGKAPFGGKSADDVLARVLAGPPPPLASLGAGVPAELVAIVERAMARDPAERYPDAAALAEELARLQTGQLVSSHRYTMWDLLRRWIKRHRALVSAGAALLVGGLAVGSLAMGRIMKASDEARAERDRARGAELATLEEQGRLELLAGRPRRAAVPLALAYASGRGGETLRLLLGEAMRAVDAEIAVLDVGAPVAQISFAGDALVTMTDRGALASWDVATQRARPLPVPEEFHPDGVVVSANGRRAAAWTSDGVRLWDLASLTPVDLERSGRDVRVVALSPDGDQIAVSAGEGGLALLGPAGEESGLRSEASFDLLAFVPGRLLGSDYESIRAWDLGTRPPTEKTVGPGMALALDCGGTALVKREIPVDGGDPTEALFRMRDDGSGTEIPDAGTVEWARCAKDGTALLRLASPPEPGAPYYIAAGQTTFPLRVQGQEAAEGRDVVGALSPDGRIAVLGSRLGELRTWDAQTGVFLGLIDAHERAVTAMSFAADGRLASASSDGTVRVWKLGTASAPAPAAEEPEAGTAFARGRDDVIAVAHEHEVEVRQGTKRLAQLTRHEEVVIGLAFSGDGERLAAAARDGRVMIWEWRTGHIVGEARAPEAATEVSLSSGGERLAAGGRDGVVRIWSLPGLRSEAEISAHTTPVRAVAWRPGDEDLVLSVGDTSVLIWDRAQRTPPRKLDTEGDEVTTAWWSPDGRLVLGISPRALRVWEAERGILVLRLVPRARGQVELVPEARDAKTVAERVRAHVPWQLTAGALALRSRPVPVRTDEVASSERVGTHYDFSDHTIEAEPGEPDPGVAQALPPTATPMDVLLRMRDDLWRHADGLAEPIEAARHLEAAAALLSSSGVRAQRTVDDNCKPGPAALPGGPLAERILDEALVDHRVFVKTFDYRYALAARRLYAAHRDLLGGNPAGITTCLETLAASVKNRFSASSQLVIQGAIDAQMVKRALDGHLVEIRHCYATALESAPELEGKVTLNFLVTNRGDVQHLSYDAAPGLAPVGDCVAPLIRSMHLPHLALQARVSINYPLYFQRVNRR